MHHARQLRRQLRAQQQHARAQIDEEEQRNRRTQRPVDRVVVREIAQIQREPVLEQLEQHRRKQRSADRIPRPHRHARDQLEDQREGRRRQQERDQDADHVHQRPRAPAERPQRIRHIVAQVARHLQQHREPDRQREQIADSQQQREINQLAPHERTPMIVIPRCVQAVPQRAHHPRRAPDQPEYADQPDRRAPLRNRVDQRLQIFPPRPLRDRQRRQQRVYHPVVQLLVGQNQPRDRDHQDRQREDREQDVVGHRRRQLRAVVVEELLHRALRQQLGVRPKPPKMQTPPAQPVFHVDVHSVIMRDAQPTQDTAHPPAPKFA